MLDKEKEALDALGQFGEKAIDFVEKIIAAPIMEGTGVFTDKLQYWRFKNKVNIIIKAREFLSKKGISVPNKMPIKDLTTLLEYSSFEEDEKMQDAWAKLLANALDPNNSFNTCHIFSQILEKLSIEELNALEYMFSQCFIASSENRPFFETSTVLRHMAAPSNLGYIMLDNLLRLRLIEEKIPTLDNKSNGEEGSYLHATEILRSRSTQKHKYRLTISGVELLRMIRL